MLWRAINSEASGTMTDEERYLFDLRGYLLVEDALTESQVDTLNAAVDGLDPWAEDTWKADELYDFCIVDSNKLHVGPLLHRDDRFKELIANPSIIPYLSEMLGDTFRLDHEYAILMNDDAAPLHLHGGGEPYKSNAYYVHKNGRMFNGLTVVSYALSDINPGEGGFCSIPGSHKSNYSLPPEYVSLDKPCDALVHVPVKAGSALIFTEALTHGTMPWTANHERRSLLYKYSPGHQAWMGQYRIEMPKTGLSEPQRLILEPPYIQLRASVVAGTGERDEY